MLLCSTFKSYRVLARRWPAGGGVKGDLEAGIHLSRLMIEANQHNPEMCLLKVDFSNAFNQVDRNVLQSVEHNFPELLGWTEYCYCLFDELRFGEERLLSPCGVQQGDSLGPLFFSLALAKLLEDTTPLTDLHLQLWYLDDGTIIGSQASVAAFFNQLRNNGDKYGLILNHSKCKLFWPCGDPEFPEFSSGCLGMKAGVNFGVPLCGWYHLHSRHSERVWIVSQLQGLVLSFDDPQVELHLIRSCLSVCKINHLLRTVSSEIIEKQLDVFDDGLRSALSSIVKAPVSEYVWLQANLPYRLGGLGLRGAKRSTSAAFCSSIIQTKFLADSFFPLKPATHRPYSHCHFLEKILLSSVPFLNLVGRLTS